MQKLNKMKSLVLIISLFLLSACNVTPPDVPVCEPLYQKLSNDPDTGHMILVPSPTCESQIGEIECGHCTYIMSGKEVYIGEGSAHWLNGKPWNLIKKQSVLVPAQESFAPLEAYIINSCKKMGCNNQVDAFKIKLNSLSGADER